MQPGADKHEGRIAVRETANHTGAAADLPVQPFNNIVCTDAGPVFAGEIAIGKRLLNAVLHLISRLFQLHSTQFFYHSFGLRSGCFLALLGVDRLEHLGYQLHLGTRRNGEHIAVKVDGTPLVLGFGKYFAHSPQPPAYQGTTLTGENLEISKSAQRGQKRILQPKDVLILFNVDTTILRKNKAVEDYINAYRLEVLTGPRPGEINGLEWADWHGDRLELRRAINCYGETTTGKNDNARRVVYLSSLARQVLEDQYRITGPKGSVFCISNLQHYHSRWKRYCKVNGLPDIAPYEIRHTFVSISDALPEAQMKKLVGHSQSMDTYGVYGHEVQGEGEEISRNLDAIFSKILSAT